MRYHNESEISIRQMQCFLVVAEQRSFSRAAIVLNMEQSTLSKCISVLEKVLGLKLFRRDTRPITLTPAGEELRQYWSKLTEVYAQSLDAAYDRVNKNRRKLTVGLVDSINTINLMPMMRRMMLDAHPGLELVLEYDTFSSWRSRLHSGAVDTVVTIRFEADSVDSEYTYAQVSQCSKSVCMLPTNPLSGLNTITYDDLRSQRFLVISPEESPAYHGYVRQLCNAHGFEPKVSRFISNAHGLFSSIQADDEVVICDKYFRNFENPMICKFDLPDTHSGLVCIWRRSNTNPYIRDFAETLRQIASTQADI